MLLAEKVTSCPAPDTPALLQDPGPRWQSWNEPDKSANYSATGDTRLRAHTHTHTHTHTHLQTGLAPSSEQMVSAKGGGGVQLFIRGKLLSDHWGWQTPTAPLHRHAQTHNHTQSAAASATAWPVAMLCALGLSVYDMQAATEDSRRVL